MPFPSCLPNLNRNGVPDRPVSRIHRMEMIVNRSSALEVLVAAVFLTGLFYFGVRYDVQNTLRQILTWIRGLGAIGPLVFAAIYVLAAVALLPGLGHEPQWCEKLLYARSLVPKSGVEADAREWTGLAFGVAKNLIARVSILARFSGPSRGRFRHGHNLYLLAMTVAVVSEVQVTKNGCFIAAEGVPGVTPGWSHTDP